MKDEMDLKQRTKLFALEIVRLYGRLPRTTDAQVIGKQILRCGTSVGAQYREAQRAKSDADFINKIQGSLQELDETIYWLEILGEASIQDQTIIKPMMAEANELISIFVTIVKKVKDRKKRQPSSFRLHP